MRCVVATLSAALLWACASAPPPPAPGRAAAYGYVRLEPAPGFTPAAPGASSYGDREYEGVALVDYSKPGFVVVYAEPGPVAASPAAAPASRASLAIRAGATHAIFDPPHAALGAGGEIAITNQSGEPHVVSCPRAGIVRRLAPGEALAIPVTGPGEVSVYLLDVAGEQASVFAAPGPYRVVSASGRFELSDLEPGPTQLRAWHPRFPPASASVDLTAGESVRVDLALRAGDPAEGADDAK